MKLYQMPAAFARLESLLAEDDGAMSDDLDAELDAMSVALEAKVEGICQLIQTRQAMASARRDESKRLRDLADGDEAKADSLRAYLLSNLRALGVERIETPLFKVRLQQNPKPSITWEGDMEALPVAFQRVRVELDGTAAHEVLKRAGTLPWGFKVTVGSHVRIS